MAAIICDILKKPCQACGRCCKECTLACGPCCKGICRCCMNTCEFCGSIFSDALSFLLTVAFTMMGVVAAFAVIGLTTDLDSCEGNMKMFFIIALVECVGHVIYAIYGYIRVHNRDKEKETFYMALYKLLIEDAWTAVYIIFDIFGFVWSVLAMDWNDNCSEKIYGTLVAVLLLLWIGLSYFIIICNLFFESVEGIICFCLFCLPYMLFPCCFSRTLKSSYHRQENMLQNPEMQPNYDSTHNPNAGAVHSPGQNVHPVAPQVSRVREVQPSSNQDIGSDVKQFVGEVGSYLWNKAKESSKQRTDKKTGGDNRIASV